MTTRSSFQLKQPGGWFAAGREIELALTLLSDAAFKLFLWLCLHAERRRGSLAVSAAELASALHKTEPETQAALDELFHQGVCRPAGHEIIEIADRFWPYQRDSNSGPQDDLAAYITHVRRCFLERRCVRGPFTPADERLAAQLHRGGVSVVDVERAILLGPLRKHAALAKHRGGTPITTLHYFTSLFDEVRQNVSPGYWTYVAHKLQSFEQRWNVIPSPETK